LRKAVINDAKINKFNIDSKTERIVVYGKGIKTLTVKKAEGQTKAG